MFNWLPWRQRTPKEVPARQVQEVSQSVLQAPTPASIPEMGFNAVYQLVQGQVGGTTAYYRLQAALRSDQRERLVFLLDATRNFEYDPETHLLRVDKPLAVANL